MDTQRRSVHLTTPQAEWLQAEANRLGLRVSELIRRIIDEARTIERQEDRS